MEIKAAVLRASKEPLNIEELELEPPRAKEVLIKHINTGFYRSAPTDNIDKHVNING